MHKTLGSQFVTRFMRVFSIYGFIFSLALQAPLIATAAVPVFVVNQPPGITETSLEAFMSDLFDTLANRQEDFTAAFELTKIEKAREDVNKLYQETLKELQDYGLAYAARDPKTGAAPMVSPLKGPRVINDPFEYIFGEPVQKARAYAACYINYLIWDQQGELDVNADGDTSDTTPNENPKTTYSSTDSASVTAQRQSSVNNLVALKREFGILMHYGHWYQEGSGGASLSQEDPFIGNLFDHDPPTGGRLRAKPVCDRVFEITRSENMITARKDVSLNKVNPDTTLGESYIRKLVGLPTLSSTLVNRKDVRSEELVQSTLNSTNSLQGIRTAVSAGMDRIINETKAIRSLTYLAGQGLRPEYLYNVETLPSSGCTIFNFWDCFTPDNSYFVNTEYIISPAVILLQKMQAATQAQYDLAGQGFIYLNADDISGTADNTIRSKYRVSTNATSTAERTICNNETDGTDTCLTISPWLKPVSVFRSAPNPGTGYVGPSTGGSGLPAPWEDNSSIVRPGYNYNVRDYNYFSINEDSTWRGAPVNDNLGSKRLGSDYATNDWYDRVLEMYESKYSTSPTLGDWTCYVKTWMLEKQIGGPFVQNFVNNSSNTVCQF